MRIDDLRNRATVLVVDDDALVRQSLAHLLRGVGIGRVHTVDAALSAIAAMRAERPDFVVTDMHMHDDADAGLAVAHAARALDVPVIVVSGSTDSTLAERLAPTPTFSKGALSPDRLLDLLDAALAARAGRPVSSSGGER